MTGPDIAKCVPLAEVVDLSLLLVQAAKAAGVDPIKARRLLDELVALPGDAAQRVLDERKRERVRRANAANRKARSAPRNTRTR